MRYKTPKALEQAVKAAAAKSDRDTSKAIAGFYHDRFLCRTFTSSEPAFVLKGRPWAAGPYLAIPPASSWSCSDKCAGVQDMLPCQPPLTSVIA